MLMQSANTTAVFPVTLGATAPLRRALTGPWLPWRAGAQEPVPQARDWPQAAGKLHHQLVHHRRHVAGPQRAGCQQPGLRVPAHHQLQLHLRHHRQPQAAGRRPPRAAADLRLHGPAAILRRVRAQHPPSGLMLRAALLNTSTVLLPLPHTYAPRAGARRTFSRCWPTATTCLTRPRRASAPMLRLGPWATSLRPARCSMMTGPTWTPPPASHQPATRPPSSASMPRRCAFAPLARHGLHARPWLRPGLRCCLVATIETRCGGQIEYAKDPTTGQASGTQPGARISPETFFAVNYISPTGARISMCFQPVQTFGVYINEEHQVFPGQ